MSGTFQVLKVRPQFRTVAAIAIRNFKPATLRKLCGGSDYRAIELGKWEDFTICCVQARPSPGEERLLNRWQLGTDMAVIAGESILFGLNSKMKAAECPMPCPTALERIEWLPPLSKIGGALIAD